MPRGKARRGYRSGALADTAVEGNLHRDTGGGTGRSRGGDEIPEGRGLSEAAAETGYRRGGDWQKPRRRRDTGGEGTGRSRSGDGAGSFWMDCPPHCGGAGAGGASACVARSRTALRRRLPASVEASAGIAASDACSMGGRGCASWCEIEYGVALASLGCVEHRHCGQRRLKGCASEGVWVRV